MIRTKAKTTLMNMVMEAHTQAVSNSLSLLLHTLLSKTTLTYLFNSAYFKDAMLPKFEPVNTRMG